MQRQSSNAMLSSAVKHARLAAGLAQRHLGSALDVSSPAISLKLSNTSGWTLEQADTMAELFGIPLSVLLTGPGEWLSQIDRDDVLARLDAIVQRRETVTGVSAIPGCEELGTPLVAPKLAA